MTAKQYTVLASGQLENGKYFLDVITSQNKVTRLKRNRGFLYNRRGDIIQILENGSVAFVRRDYLIAHQERVSKLDLESDY